MSSHTVLAGQPGQRVLPRQRQERIESWKVQTCPLVVTQKSPWKATFRGELGQKCGFGE